MKLYTTASGQKVTVPENDTTGERLEDAERLVAELVSNYEGGNRTIPAIWLKRARAFLESA